MKSKLRILVLLAACACGTAFAQTHTAVCPSPADCVRPQWGEIQPDGTDSLTAPSPMASAMAARPALVRVRMDDGTKLSVAPKIVVDDGVSYPRETKSLVVAILAARFDADGKLVSGAERIEKAVARVNAVARNHQLTLYLKAVKVGDRALLGRKVEALNALLASKDGYK